MMSTSRRPYLLRAMHEWMTDNGLTPHIIVDTTIDGVSVPRAFVNNDRIILNIKTTAAYELEIGNRAITFQARFDGVLRWVSVPPGSVIGIYSRETKAGMTFAADSTPSEEIRKRPKGKPQLSIVKSGSPDKEREGKSS